MKFATLAIFLGTISAEQFDQELINELKIEVSRAGQRAIEKEARDVGVTLDKIQKSRPVRNLEASFKRFAQTKEVHQVEQLDKKFLASPEGKRLMKEWRDVGQELKAHLKQTKKGIHYENKHIDDLSDELDDVADQYKALDGSKWDKAYEVAFKRAFATKQAESLGRRAKSFKGSAEGKALVKEMVDLKMAIKKNLKITDIDSSDDEEDLDDIESMIKIEQKTKYYSDFQDQLNDLEKTWKSIEHSRPVRNVEASLKRLEQSEEMEDLETLDKKFLATPRGKRMAKEIEEVFKQVDKSIWHSSGGYLLINGYQFKKLDDELTDVQDQFRSFKKSKWNKMYRKSMKKVFTNKEAHGVYKSMEAFGASPQGKRLEKEMKDVEASAKKTYKITDLPKNFSEEDDLFLF